MLRWVYFSMVFIMVSLAFTWCYQILYTVPNDGSHHPKLNSTEYRYFLHITDFHLDSRYLAGATVKSACHDLPTSIDVERMESTTGSFGISGCDTPIALAQKTLDWVAKEFKDKLDFVIWTGDNARHDWDKRMKRSRADVYESNRLMTKMMQDTFGSHLPIVPTLGNNDVIPHNQITKGGQQNKKTDKLLHFYQDLWDHWIPENQQDDFLKYGAFVVDVAPRLRALSLNSMYFIKKNKKVQGCHKPGTAQQHMDWFQQQLENAYVHGYKVVVLGHVPPSDDNYRSSCLESYTQISSIYSDIIVGHLYGHLNKDHFLLYDTSRVDGQSSDSNNTVLDHGVNQQSHQQQQQQHPMTISTRKIKVPKFARQLHDMYASLNPRPEQLSDGKSLQKSAVVAIQVTPSVLPKYYPTVRLYRYTKNDQGTARLMGYEQYFANITEWEQQEEHDYQLLYSTDEYGMDDLSALSFFDLAKRMVDPRDKKGRQLWKTFVNNIFIQTRNIF